MTIKQLIDLPLAPGIYTEETDRGATSRWKDGNRVRFRRGLPEKIGGWQRLAPMFLGTARNIMDWASLDGTMWSAIGTDWKLYLWRSTGGGQLYDITPIRREINLTNPFTTVNGSDLITVTDPGHGCRQNDFVTFSGATAVAGVDMNGEFQVIAVLSYEQYVVQAVAASADATGGGDVFASYQINTGPADTGFGRGWGTGTWNQPGTTWGTPRPGSSFIVGARTWSLDNWGEDLIATPFGGSIYWWRRINGPGVRALKVENAPDRANFTLISQRDRQLFAFGAIERLSGVFDPLLIRWCAQEDLEDWVPEVFNTSGDIRLFSGSKIVAGIKTRGEILVFTDTTVHSLVQLGPGNYGTNVVGENVSMLGPNAGVAVDHRVLFMAEGDFYLYDGVLRVLPCDVRNHVYSRMDFSQKEKVFAGLNREFNEVWWFYPEALPEEAVLDPIDIQGADTLWFGLSLPGQPTPEQFRPIIDEAEGEMVNRGDATTSGGYRLDEGVLDLGRYDFEVQMRVEVAAYVADHDIRTGHVLLGMEPGNTYDSESQADGQRVYFCWGGVSVAFGRYYNTSTTMLSYQVVISSSNPDAIVNYEVAALPFTIGVGAAVDTRLRVRRISNLYSVWLDDVLLIEDFDPGAYQSGGVETAAVGPGNTASNRRVALAMSASNLPDLTEGVFKISELQAITLAEGETFPAVTDGSPAEISDYVCLNYEEGAWSIGKVIRTAWADRSPVMEKPYAAGKDGYLYKHETGTDDHDQPLTAHLKSYDMEVAMGEELVHIDQLVPDFLVLEGGVTVTLRGRKYPQEPSEIVKGPYPVVPGTRKISTRMRARQVSLEINSDQLGDRWRMGRWRGRAGVHGKRG